VDWQLIIEPDAKKDIREGFDYYKEQAGVEIARRFRERVRAGMRKVLEAPERWPVFDEHGGRRYLLGKFPYGIIYDLEGPLIVVIAVMHTRQEPEYYR
jgi:toxin ParE1/3/4